MLGNISSFLCKYEWDNAVLCCFFRGSVERLSVRIIVTHIIEKVEAIEIYSAITFCIKKLLRVDDVRLSLRF